MAGLFLLVQTWGRDRYRQATVISTHETLHGAYAELDSIVEKLQRDGAPDESLKIHVVNEAREPMTRPGAH